MLLLLSHTVHNNAIFNTHVHILPVFFVKRKHITVDYQDMVRFLLTQSSEWLFIITIKQSGNIGIDIMQFQNDN